MQTPSQPNPIGSSPTQEPFSLKPIPDSISLVSVIDNLLKFPGRVFFELRKGRAVAVTFSLFAIAMICLAVYGLVVGSQTGGSQLWIAPLKILAGSLLSAIICLPSLYIFLCLKGVDIAFHHTCSLVLAMLALTALLLLSFAPVAWIFSQSTDVIPLMAFLHLCFWAVALIFGLRFLGRGAMAGGTRSGAGPLAVWALVYAVVCLQMMTTLRPIIGQSTTFLASEKKFFLSYWVDVLFR